MKKILLFMICVFPLLSFGSQKHTSQATMNNTPVITEDNLNYFAA